MEGVRTGKHERAVRALRWTGSCSDSCARSVAPTIFCVPVQSKLANILYTYELDRQLKPGDNCTANTLHPGIVGTNLGR